MERVLEPTWHEAGGVAFELERFAPAGRGRLELSGRWFGVRGRRFVRPMLTLRADGERRRLLADLEHKPWAAGDGEPWRASFPWNHESDEVSDVELTVGPDIAVELPAPGGHGGRGQRTRAQSRRRSEHAQRLALRRELQDMRRQLARQEEAAAALLGEERDRRARVQSELEAVAAQLEEAQTELERLRAERGEAQTELERLRAERDEAQTNAEQLTVERDQAIEAAQRATSEHQQLAQALREAEAELKSARSAARARRFAAGVAPARSEAGVGRRSEAGAAPAHSEVAPAPPELGARSEARAATRSEPAIARSSSPVSVPPPAVPSGPPPQPTPPPSHPPLLTPASRSRRLGRYSTRREADWMRRLLAVAVLVAVLIAFAVIMHIR